MLRTGPEELCLQVMLLKLGEIVPFVEKAMQPPNIKGMLQHADFTLRSVVGIDP